MDEDRNQMKNLASKYPEKLEEMKNLWFMLAGKYNGLPLDDREGIDVLLTPRPQPSKPRDQYVYYSATSGVPEAVAVNIRGRSYNIAAYVNVSTPEPRGVLFCHGSRFGGHTLYVKDFKLHYVYNWLGEKHQKLISNSTVPQGECILGVRFHLEGRDGPSPSGTAALYINDLKVAESRIITQPGKFGLGSDLYIGKNVGEPITDDYETPFEFKGGVIKQVIVDVSGESFQDLAKEMQNMLMRD